MADPNTVNPQITDSVSQALIFNFGVASTYSVDQLCVAVSCALGHAAHNATSNQQQLNTLAQAVTTMGATMIYSIDTAVIAKGATANTNNKKTD